MVDGNGFTSRGRLTQSAGDSRLDGAALRIVQRLRFTPARLGNRPVTAWMSLPIEFGRAAPGPSLPAEPDSLGVYEIAEVEALPVLANRAAVAEELSRVYPRELADRGIAGTVLVVMVVDVDGSTRDVRVEQSSAMEFSGAAVLVAGKMRFTPARVNGRPVPVRITLPVQFQIATSPPAGPDPLSRPPIGRERERGSGWPE